MAAIDAFEDSQLREARPIGPRLDSREHRHSAAALANETKRRIFSGTFL
jgi:hypothetical protein